MPARLTAATLLDAWDAGAERGALDRALLLLWAAGEPGAELAALPLDERDRRLLALRAATFGDRIACLAECPDCGAALELDLSVAGLIAGLPASGPEVLALGGGSIALRPLDSRDLADAAECADLDSAAALLTARAIDGGTPDLGAADRAALLARIEARTAAGELGLALACPDCGRRWAEVLDVARFVWAEVEAAALRLMAEVAEIARAFGWTEGEILGLSPRRRQGYLALARGA